MSPPRLTRFGRQILAEARELGVRNAAIRKRNQRQNSVPVFRSNAKRLARVEEYQIRNTEADFRMTNKETWHNAGKFGSDTLVADSDGTNIADVYGEYTNPNFTRHLALIIAAPDLYAACKALIKKIDWAFDSEIQGALAKEVDAAEAAIGKAEGRG